MPGRNACLALLFCALSFTSYSQKNLKEAIVVLNNADSSKGFIDYKEGVATPSSILFTTERNKPTGRFAVKEVSYFELTGLAQYKRYTVRVSLDNNVMSTLSEKDTSSATSTVFLRILQKGKNVTLFSYTDELKKHFYILDRDETTPIELQNSVYMLNGQVKEDRQYQSVLLTAASKYLPGDGDIISQISNAHNYEDEIADICQKFNGLEKSTSAAPGKAPHGKSSFRVYIGGGINHGALVMDGANMFTGKNSHPFYAPVVAAGADFLFNPLVGKLVFRGQFHITSYKTDGYNFVDYTQYTEQYTFSFKQINFAFTPQLLYNLYNQKNLKWFVSAGIGLNFSSYPVNELKFVRSSSTDVSGVTVNNYVAYVRSFWINPCFTTGVDLSRLEMSFLFFPSSSITQSTSYGLNNTSLQLRLSYFIKK